MKRKITAWVVLWAAAVLAAGPAHGAAPDQTSLQSQAESAYLQGLIALDSRIVRPSQEAFGSKAVANSIRLKAMRREAVEIGAQGALYFVAKQVNGSLKKYAEALSAAFDFHSLLITDSSGRSIMPPVITEASGEAVISDNGQRMRVAAKNYRIARPAHFVLAAPTWRDYLSLAFDRPTAPDEFLRPENEAEDALWAEWIKEGWRMGMRQGRQIATNKLRLLVRDMRGVIRYHLLRLKGYVAEPVVDADYYSVTGGGDQMAIEDVILTIQQPAALNPNSSKWSPIPQLPDVGYLGLESLDQHQDPKTLWDTMPTKQNTHIRGLPAHAPPTGQSRTRSQISPVTGETP